MLSVLKGLFYYVKDYQHTTNESLYISKSRENAFNNVMQGVAHEGLKKLFSLPLLLPTWAYA
jgi:hypothetical protein